MVDGEVVNAVAARACRHIQRGELRVGEPRTFVGVDVARKLVARVKPFSAMWACLHSGVAMHGVQAAGDLALRPEWRRGEWPRHEQRHKRWVDRRAIVVRQCSRLAWRRRGRFQIWRCWHWRRWRGQLPAPFCARRPRWSCRLLRRLRRAILYREVSHCAHRGVYQRLYGQRLYDDGACVHRRRARHRRRRPCPPCQCCYSNRGLSRLIAQHTRGGGGCVHGAPA